ncbi:MAG TPA: hypothetical protein VJN21_15460 [Candidatus Acidoferrales bacterium]|nr:hypothetical protein [Candidatus Acidoferrales bacterium]
MGSRATSTLWSSGLTMFRAFWKLARQVFHEVIGTFFALFALYGGAAAWRQHKQPTGQWVTVFAVVYALMMAYFSISAFRSARRVR